MNGIDSWVKSGKERQRGKRVTSKPVMFWIEPSVSFFRMTDDNGSNDDGIVKNRTRREEKERENRAGTLGRATVD